MKWNWKQITVSLLLGLILGTAAGRWSVIGFHHDFGPPEERGERMFRDFSRNLKLTPEQRETAWAIFEETDRKIIASHDKDFPRDEALREEAKQKLQAMLTPEQKEIFKSMEEKREKRQKENKKRHGPPPPKPWR